MNLKTGQSASDLPAGTVTFLFTDIEGSTLLLNQLGEAYVRLLADHHRLLRAAFGHHNGSEVDTEGDAFFVSFPRAADALAAVVEAQRDIAQHDWPGDAQVRVRMGLHTGEPWTGGEGYVGMDVHRAARIAHTGHGGQVLLSATATQLLLDQLPEGVSLLDLGYHRLKDMKRPEHIQQLVIEGLPADFPPLKSLGVVVPPQPIIDKPPEPPPFLKEVSGEPKRPVFVSRQRELAWLTERLDQAIDGQGQVVFVTGEAGSGKSSLLGAFTRQATEQNSELLVTWGQCNAFSGQGDPYLPFREIFAQLCGEVKGSWRSGLLDSEAARRLWMVLPETARIMSAEGDHLLANFVSGKKFLGQLKAAAPKQHALHNQIKVLVDRDPYTSAGAGQSQLFEQATTVLEVISQQYPLLVILDDMQWVDRGSVDLLFQLGRQITHHRMLVVAAYRPEEVAAGRRGERHPLDAMVDEFKRIYGDQSLDLAKVEGRAFVDAFIDSEPNQLDLTFRDRLFQRTGGHALFTVELLRDMEERGHLVKDDDGKRIESKQLDWDLLPARVEGVIESRIGRLEESLREILTVASVEGETFTAQIVAGITGQPERKILGSLSQVLQRQHRLVREQEEVETIQRHLTRYRFRHILFQEYLYKSLSHGERRLLHGEVATALEELYARELEDHSVELTHHTFQAGQLEPAFHYAAMAAERASRLFDSSEAIRLYSQAIDLAATITVDPTSKAMVFRGRGLAYDRLGDFDKAEHDYEMGLQVGLAEGHERITWRACLDLGKLWASRDYGQTRSWFEKALVIARELDDPACLSTSLNWVGNWYANNNTTQTAINYHLEALEIFSHLGDRLQEAHTYDLLGTASLIAGDLITSVDYYDKAIAIFQQLNDLPALVRSLLGRVTDVALRSNHASLPAGSITVALADLEKARDIVNKINSAPDDAWACWSGSMVLIVHGEFGEALRVAQKGLRIASDIGHREWQVTCRVALGMSYSELFAYDLALEQLERAYSHMEELRSLYYISFVAGALASVNLASGNVDKGQAIFKQIGIPEQAMDGLGYRRCWVGWVELALLRGEYSQALVWVEQLIKSAPGWQPGKIIPFLEWQKGRALVGMGQEELAIPVYGAALQGALESGERYLLWQIRAEYAQLLAAAGKQQSAERELTAAQTQVEELAETVSDPDLKRGFLEGAATFMS